MADALTGLINPTTSTNISPAPSTSGRSSASIPTAFPVENTIPSPTQNQPATPPPAVVTGKDATAAVGDMNNFVAGQTQSMANQSANNAQTKATADQQAATDKAANDVAKQIVLDNLTKQQDAATKAKLATTATTDETKPPAPIDYSKSNVGGWQVDLSKSSNPDATQTQLNDFSNSLISSGKTQGSYEYDQAMQNQLKSLGLNYTNPTWTAGENQKGVSVAQASTQFENQVQGFQNTVNSISNGTYKLTPEEQSQVDGLQHTFDLLVKQQQISNQNYEAGTARLGGRQGISRYSPQLAMDNIQAAVNSGVAKVQDIESKAATAVATLKQALVDKDFTHATAAYDMAKSLLTEKTDTIKTINQNVKDQVDAINTKTQNDLNTQKANIDIQTKKVDSISQAAAQNLTGDATANMAAITSMAKANGVDPQALYSAALEKQQATQKEQAAQNVPHISGEHVDAMGNKISEYSVYDPTAPNNMRKLTDGASAAVQSGVPISGVLSPVGNGLTLGDYITKTSSDNVYVNLATVTDAKEKVAVTKAARANGIPIIVAGDGAKLNAMDDARTNLGKISDSLSGLLATTPGTNIAQGLLNSIKDFGGVQGIRDFKAWRTAIINNVQALAGGAGSGLRINQAEISTAMENDLPVIEGIGADTVGSAQGKMDKLTSQLDTWEQTLLKNSGARNVNNENAPQDFSNQPKTATFGGKTYTMGSDGLYY